MSPVHLLHTSITFSILTIEGFMTRGTTSVFPYSTFHFLSCNIPSSPTSGVYVSQLVLSAVLESFSTIKVLFVEGEATHKYIVEIGLLPSEVKNNDIVDPYNVVFLNYLMATAEM